MPLKRYQRWWAYIILFIAFYIAAHVAAHATRSFIAEAFVVPERSMSPTIHPGDRILVDKFRRDSESIKRNDVVVFRTKLPDSPLFVMRVAGLPGETIEIENERVLINGEPLDDRHAEFIGPSPERVELLDYGPEKIPSDCFFVLGDNRRLSRDSRFLGPIPLSDFYGQARLIYWSRERMFPDPHDTSNYTLGPMRWNRMGARLD